MKDDGAGPRKTREQRFADERRRDLRRWATVYAQRDQLVRMAADTGVGVNEITRITGLAKTTVLRILRPEGGQ